MSNSSPKPRTFTLTFSMENDAFAEFPEVEVRNILRRTIDQLNDDVVTCRVHDSNGNRIGFWTFDEVK